MDLNATLAKLKQEPGFQENVGMVLIHNGVVRGRSRNDGKPVQALQVTPDQELIETLRKEYESRPGIFRILIQANEGRFVPGEDLLFIIVAGDVRENVKSVLGELLNRVKSEAISKHEL